MAENGAGGGVAYSCHCLNVSIAPVDVPVAPESPEDGARFVTVRVGEDGISIAHPQLTLRDRSKAVESVVQYVSLSCLVCNQLVYRVAHAIVPGEEAREGPVVPTAEWTESDVLRSSTGLIDVALDCLTGEALRQAHASERFSDTFAILVTSTPQPLAAHSQSPNSPQYVLPPFPTPPLFAPPPFSPSHPAFTHLSKRAQARSEQRRRQAEGEIQQLVVQRLQELDAADKALKNEVEAIWRSFRNAWRAAVERIPQDDVQQHPLYNVSNTLSFVDPALGPSSLTNNTSLITRRPSLNRSYSSQSHQPSLLSASLRQTGFHVPTHNDDEVDERSSPPPYASTRHMSDTSDTSRPPQYDAVSVSGSPPAEFRRNMDANLDISTSLRITSMLAQQAADEPSQPKKKKKKVTRQWEEHENATASTSGVPSSSTALSPSALSSPRGPSLRTSASTPEKDRTRRKVTFEDEPEVVVIQPPPPPPAPVARIVPMSNGDHVEEEALFELEGLDEPHPALPVSPARSAVHANGISVPSSRVVNGRAARTSSLLASMSYRAPSAMSASVPSAPAPVSASAPPEHFKPYEEHLRSLVAADTPTHREGWKKGGKAWAMFARGRRYRAALDSDEEPAPSDDEDEDDEAPQQYARSLPMPIGPIASLAARRPPLLDDVAEEPEGAAATTATARQRAALISRRRNDAPEDGLWHSLA